MFLFDLLLFCNSERFSSEKLAHQDHAAPVGKCVILLEMSRCKYAAEADILTDICYNKHLLLGLFFAKFE
jgi:hypothetical protein